MMTHRRGELTDRHVRYVLYSRQCALVPARASQYIQTPGLFSKVIVFVSSRHTCTCPTFFSRVSCVGHSFIGVPNTPVYRTENLHPPRLGKAMKEAQSTNRGALKSFFYRACVTALPFGLNILFSALSSNISE
jgi:hypothetical protein